jgi:uncharacterized Rmd1/YagE family protein
MTIDNQAVAISKSMFSARALYVGERIDLRKYLPPGRVTAQQPATVPVDGGLAILFRYGAVVFFDAATADHEQFLRELAPLVEDRYDRPETEEIAVCVSPDKREGVEAGNVIVRNAAIERLQVVAAALGKSVALAQYEADVAANFDQIEPFAVDLEQRGRGGRRDMRLLLKHIGRGLLNEHKMVARVEVSDRPELLWDHPELEQLYLRLEDEFELQERTEILDRKLGLISRTVETILDLLQRDRSSRVEWYIVILIVMELVLSIYGLFRH